MNKQVPIPTQAEIDNTHFDFSQPVTILNDPDAAQDVEFEVLERGSDTHIAFLEQAEPPRLSRRLQPLRGLEHEHREAVLT